MVFSGYRGTTQTKERASTRALEGPLLKTFHPNSLAYRTSTVKETIRITRTQNRT